MKHKTSKLLSILLALALVMGIAPAMSQTAQAAGTNKAIQLVDHGGTTSVAANIEGGQKSAVYFGTYKQSPDGSDDFNWDPIKWRVLSNADGKLFLLSDQNLDVMRYHNDDESVTWEKSTMRSWLNGYGASENTGGDSGTDYSSDNFIKDAFAAAELAAIASTNVVNDSNPDHGTAGGNNTTDKVFLLSIDEAGNSGYGFTDDNSRISTNTAYVEKGGKIYFDEGISVIRPGVGEADCWWLRSPGDDDCAASVNGDGFVDTDGYYVILIHVAVRPAFHLNLNSVLFTSAAADGKAGTAGELSEIGEYTGNEWKLTLKDESRKFAVTETAATGAPGDTVTVNYTGATVKTDEAPYEYISAILTDKNGNLLRYGRLTQPTSADGKVDVKIPADLAEGEYTLKVFSEQYNGALLTDYASAFDDVTLTVSITVEVTGITLNSDNAKKVYTEGDPLDVSGLTLEVEKSDGSKETVNVTEAMVSGFDSSKTGKQTLTVSYEGFTATYEVEVKAKTNPPTPVITYEAKDDSGNTVNSITWQKGSEETIDLTIHRSVDDELTYGLFENLTIDDEVVDDRYYDAASGSLKLTIKPEYLETLSVGDHTVQVNFQDGSATVKLTVIAAAPKTGDESNLALWSSLMFLSVAAMVVLLPCARKRETEK